MAEERNAVVVKILAVVSLVLTALAGVGWIVFLGGFGYLTNDAVPGADISQFTGPIFDGFWIGSVLSPVLFILLIVKATLMIIKDKLFRKFFIIHILAVITFIITVIVLCFLGFILVYLRFDIQHQNEPIPMSPSVTAYINALFAGALLEVLFLGAAWICHILAHLFGGVETIKV